MLEFTLSDVIIQGRSKKRTLRLEIYKKLLGYTCAHPECDSGLGIEAHHVRPLYKGGEDKFWNIISLCWKCHHTKKLHSRSEQKITELYVYKTMHELTKLGFSFDEQEPAFLNNYRSAVKALDATEDEKFIYNSIDRMDKLEPISKAESICSALRSIMPKSA